VVGVDLNLRGQAVTRVCFDVALVILTSGDYELRVETEAVLQVSLGNDVTFDPESSDVVAAHLVRLVGDVIIVAEAGGAGDLVIEFESGMKLAVRPNDDYEAWGLVGREGRRIICMPGGEIAVWSGK
jgi:hypothetical protein